MSSVLTGNPDTIAATTATDITIPSDADALNVASVNPAFDALADMLATLRIGPTTDGNAQITTTTAPTFYKLIWSIAIGGGKFARLYSYADRFIVTVNALNVPASTSWGWDLAADSTRWTIYDDRVTVEGHAAAGGTPWIDALWGITTPGTADTVLNNTGSIVAQSTLQSSTGSITAVIGNVVASAGDVVATLGNVTAGALITGGTGVVATTGDISATVGNVTANGSVSAGTTVVGAVGVTATTGDVAASAGNVSAAGTVVGSAGPGLVKAKRFYGTGTAITTARVSAISGGWGATAQCTAVTGNDSACSVTITAQGGGYATGASFVFTYISGTWTTAPIVTVAFKRNSSATPMAANVEWDVSATAVTVYFTGLPVAADTYEFVIKSEGV